MSTATATPGTDLAAAVPVQGEAPAAVPLAAAAEDRPTGTPVVRQVLSWAGQVGCFVGAGLVGAGVVHRPLDPSRYTTVALAGVVVFVLASLVTEVLLTDEEPSRGRLLRLLGCSLLLSVGVGMLSGGVQHFSDARGWTEVVVAAGLVLSWLAHALRTGWGRRQTAVTTAAALLLAAAVHTGLSLLPAPPPAAQGHAPGPTAVQQDAPVEPAATAPAPGGAVDLTEELARLGELTRQLEELRAG